MPLKRAALASGWIAPLVLLAASTLAEPPEPPRGRAGLADLVARLDSTDVADRNTASELLASSRAVSLRDIETALRDPALSSEQRQRLIVVAERRFREEPRAAIGISFARDGVSTVVNEVEPGFPAAAFLQPGDRIESINGLRIGKRDDLRPRVFQYDPGDEVTLGVVRNQVSSQVRIRLGSYAAHRNVGGQALGRDELDAAWALRSAPYAQANGALSPPIDGGAAPVVFLIDGAADQEEPEIVHRFQTGLFRDEALERDEAAAVIGGQSRGVTAPEGAWNPNARFANTGAVRIIPPPAGVNAGANVIFPVRPGPNPAVNINILPDGANARPQNPAVVGQEDAKTLIRDLRRRCDGYRERIADNNRRLADTDTPEAYKRVLRDENADYYSKISQLRDQMSLIQDSLRPKR